MAVHLFKKKDFSSVYRRYMHPTSSEVMDLILSYVEEKKGKPYGMALDVGCGTGRYTMALARHFQKVLGVDISESQIQEAKAAIVPNNVSYQISSAENLPLEDASVDLVNAGLAAHWFNLEKFVQEAVRVLKPNGCLAVHAFYPLYTIQYGDVSEALSAIITEVFSTLFKYKDKTTDHMICYYQEIFKAVPFPDKRWVPDIPVTFSMYLADMMGHIQSIYMYQAFSELDPEAAEKFLMKSELRFRDILGADSDTAAMKVFCRHYCVLACKS